MPCLTRSRSSLGTVLLGAAQTLGCLPDPPGPGPDPTLQGCEWSSESETGGDGLGSFEAELESVEFQQYMSNHVVPVPHGGWLVEGDMYTSEMTDVFAAYRHYQASLYGNARVLSDSGFRSSVFCDLFLGIDVINDPAQKLALTYCLDRTWDLVPGFRDLTIAEFTDATLAWESAADVNFVPLQNGEICSHANGANMIVQYKADCDGTDPCNILGSAPFPGTPEEERIIGIYPPAFISLAKLEQTVIHELGHTLGLFHEHGRFNQQTNACINSSFALPTGPSVFARGVTERDGNSVMGYGQCLGTNPTPPFPTPLDRAGLAFLYNLPRPTWGGVDPAGDSGTLVWHLPTAGEYVVWDPALGPGGTLDFIETAGCYYDDCSAGASPHWKPILINASNSVDVLMYGPGQFEERRFLGLNGVVSTDVPAVLESNNDVPFLLDRFFGANDRSVWWVRPSYINDEIWQDVTGTTTPSDQFNELPLTDEHYAAVMGRFLPLSNAALWLSPTALPAYLTWPSGDVLQQLEINKVACGLADEVAYDAIPGNYDNDGVDEVLWYDFVTGNITYWPQLIGCVSHAVFHVGQAKVASFSFGETRDRLMVYKPQAGTVQFYDVANGSPLAAAQAMAHDAAPVLRDFDSDGCTDILWFTPHLNTSRVWQSNCDTTFTESLVEHPEQAYPLGYGLGHGRG